MNQDRPEYVSAINADATGSPIRSAAKPSGPVKRTRKVMNLETGAKPAPTISDVARLAQVSEATVSRALRAFPQVRPDLRDRVLAAAEELSYVTDTNASRLASGITRTIGLVAPQLTTWYVSQLSAGINDIMQPAGLDLLISALSSPSRRDELRSGAKHFRQRVDGVVLVDAFVGPDWTAGIGSPPAIVVGEELNAGNSLGIDDVLGGELAVRHLLRLGHQQIAVIGGSSPTARFSPVSELRTRGAALALAEAGLEIHTTVDGLFSIAGGLGAARELLRLPKRQRPTALFCLSDEMAFGALQAARELDVAVPDEISIVGFDDHPVAESVGLTTIRQPVRRLGQRAAQRLLLADGIPVTGHERLPIELVVRSSSSAPRAT